MISFNKNETVNNDKSFSGSKNNTVLTDNKKNNKPIKIVVSAYDVSILEEVIKMYLIELKKIKVSGVKSIPLPTRRKLISLITSPHKYKDSQEQFEQLTHRRVIFLDKIDKKCLDQLNKIIIPSSVQIKWVIR